MEEGINLIFGANTDADTFEMVFGHLANGYVIAVNGQDMVCHELYNDGEVVGLYGYSYDDEREDGLNFDPVTPIGYEWDEIESVEIY